jgi:hypothetical protein
MMVAQENTRMQGKRQSVKLIEVEEKIRSNYARGVPFPPPGRPVPVGIAKHPVGKASCAGTVASIEPYESKDGRSSLRGLLEQIVCRVCEADLDEFAEAMRDVVELADSSVSFCTEALHLAKRAINI